MTAIDAALAGVFWLLAFSSALNCHLTIAAPIVLGLSIWLVYSGDRWFDVRSTRKKSLPTSRHRFAARYHRTLFALWLVGLAANIAVALTLLDRAQLTTGLAVLIACIAYTLGVQKRWLPPQMKELHVAAIFGAGVSVFFVGQGLVPDQVVILGFGLIAFTLVCFANCVLIARWEVGIDAQLKRGSLARGLGRRSSQLSAFAWLALAVSAGASFVFPPAIGLVCYCALLLAQDRWEWPVDLEDRRALCDGSLALIGLLTWLVLR